MMSVLRGGRVKLGSALAMAMVGQLAVALPAQAQAPEATTSEIRMRQLEAEVRALQRQVFPTPGTVSAPATAGTSFGTPVGTPASAPMTDVLARMDVLEAQIARLTAQYEEMGNRLRQVENRLGGAAPAAMGPVAAPVATPAPTPLVPAPVAQPAPVASVPDARPSAQRVAAVKAIVKPQSGDAGEDEYSYGFKLYQAKFYPEAEQQLKLFLSQYPAHRRATYARNLIGRAYLDDGKAREAAPWFLQNYQANKRGDRAADSLLNLATAMVQMKDTNRACIALAEFADAYKTEATGRLKGQYDQTRGSVTCN